MKALSTIFFMVCVSAICVRANAVEYSRSVSVLRVLAVGTVRPAGPPSQNIIRIYFTPEPWGTSSCRGDAADISPADWHLYALALQAWRTNRTAVVLVDDSLRLDGTDVVCQATAITVL